MFKGVEDLAENTQNVITGIIDETRKAALDVVGEIMSTVYKEGKVIAGNVTGMMYEGIRRGIGSIFKNKKKNTPSPNEKK